MRLVYGTAVAHMLPWVQTTLRTLSSQLVEPARQASSSSQLIELARQASFIV